MRVAFAAAGTGGHVYPALAVAEALVAAGLAAGDIVFFGGHRLEASVVPAAGFELVELELRGLERSLSPRNLSLPLVVARAADRIGTELARRGVAALAAFGGYVTVPAAWGARRRHVPVVIHEQNAVPGLANRLAARVAVRRFVAFPAAARRLRAATVVGNPLRPSLARFDRETLRAEARAAYGLSRDGPVLGVLGGSQGARTLNEVALDFLARHGEGVEVLHLAGPRLRGEVAEHAAGRENWHVLGFEDAMERFYAAVDLVLARAGALTVSELAATATPAVLVPYAHGTGDHQAANAEELARAGGCLVVGEPSRARLPDLLAALLHDRDRRREMARAAAGTARKDAATVLAAAILEIAHD